jgi:hypothetical protein
MNPIDESRRPPAGSLDHGRDARRRQLAAIHAIAKNRGLPEDVYRAMVERISRRRTSSAGELSAAERHRLLDELNGGAAKTAVKPQTRKIRALWSSLWALGAVEDESLSAIDAFVARQTGVDSARWLPAEAANQTIEALKDWCARLGWRVPAAGGRAVKGSLIAHLAAKAPEITLPPGLSQDEQIRALGAALRLARRHTGEAAR